MTAGTLREEAGQSAALSEVFERIIRKCMDSNMEKRYASAGEVEDALQALCTRKLTEEKEQKTIPSHILLVTGMKAGTGTTHLAFGLVCFLNKTDTGRCMRNITPPGQWTPWPAGQVCVRTVLESIP